MLLDKQKASDWAGPWLRGEEGYAVLSSANCKTVKGPQIFQQIQDCNTAFDLSIVRCYGFNWGFITFTLRPLQYLQVLQILLVPLTFPKEEDHNKYTI